MAPDRPDPPKARHSGEYVRQQVRGNKHGIKLRAKIGIRCSLLSALTETVQSDSGRTVATASQMVTEVHTGYIIVCCNHWHSLSSPPSLASKDDRPMLPSNLRPKMERCAQFKAPFFTRVSSLTPLLQRPSAHPQENHEWFSMMRFRDSEVSQS